MHTLLELVALSVEK